MKNIETTPKLKTSEKKHLQETTGVKFLGDSFSAANPLESSSLPGLPVPELVFPDAIKHIREETSPIHLQRYIGSKAPGIQRALCEKLVVEADKKPTDFRLRNWLIENVDRKEAATRLHSILNSEIYDASPESKPSSKLILALVLTLKTPVSEIYEDVKDKTFDHFFQFGMTGLFHLVFSRKALDAPVSETRTVQLIGAGMVSLSLALAILTIVTDAQKALSAGKVDFLSSIKNNKDRALYSSLILSETLLCNTADMDDKKLVFSLQKIESEFQQDNFLKENINRRLRERIYFLMSTNKTKEMEQLEKDILRLDSASITEELSHYRKTPELADKLEELGKKSSDPENKARMFFWAADTYLTSNLPERGLTNMFRAVDCISGKDIKTEERETVMFAADAVIEGNRKTVFPELVKNPELWKKYRDFIERLSEIKPVSDLIGPENKGSLHEEVASYLNNNLRLS